MFQSNDTTGLTELQRKAFFSMQMGDSVFITGPAGVGKSHCISVYRNWVSKIDSLNVAVTSMTGVSALEIKGNTIHNWSGIGLGKESAGELARTIWSRKKYRKRWLEINVLIIDEISMMTPDTLDKLDHIAKSIRKNSNPFGGIQLILSGDLCQLKPVKTDEFCYEAKCWPFVIKKMFHFTEIIRQKNKVFQSVLNNIRMGIVTKKDSELLQSRVKLHPPDGIIKPTKLYSRKKIVQKTNTEALNKLKAEGNPSKTYTAKYRIENNSSYKLTEKQTKTFVDKMRSRCQAEDLLELAIGSQVMLICNLDVEKGYANGSRGVVAALTDEGPKVYFRNGHEELIDQWTWTDSSENRVNVSKIQIPLILADAATIHKAQGCTIDYLEVDLGRSIFDYGQSYTALSRVRELDGLFITDIDYSKIKLHPKVREFYNKLSE